MVVTVSASPRDRAWRAARAAVGAYTRDPSPENAQQVAALLAEARSLSDDRGCQAETAEPAAAAERAPTVAAS